VARLRRLYPPSRGGDLRTFGTSSFEARLHLEETIVGADGERSRLRLARTGIHRLLMTGTAVNQVWNLISRIRYVFSRNWSWTLTVVHRGEWGDKTVVEERFPNRAEGSVRAEGLIELLANNPDYGEALRQASTRTSQRRPPNRGWVVTAGR